MGVFFQKVSIFGKNSNFIQDIVWSPCYRFLPSVKLKVVVNESLGKMNTGIQLLDCSKSAINCKNNNDVTTSQHDIIVFYCSGISQLRFSVQVSWQYCNWFWSCDYFWFIRNLIRNLEIEKTPVWFLSYIWKLEWAKDMKLCMNVPYRNLPNITKCLVYTFYYLTLFLLHYLGLLSHFGDSASPT